MSSPMGVWRNAPLAYVLAEVRTELIAELTEYLPKIASRLRERFPLQREVSSIRLVATPTGMTINPMQGKGWELATVDRRMAVLIRPNGLVLHTTKYEGGSKAFLPMLADVLTMFAEVVPAVFVNRIGLRYVDFVIPREGETPEAYVSGRLNPDFGVGRGDRPYSGMIVSAYGREKGTLTLRYMRGHGQPELPSDLDGLELTPSPLMRGKDGKTSISDILPTAAIDTDRMYLFDPVEQLNAAKIIALYGDMHQDISGFFKNNVITEYANSIWNPAL